MRDQSDRFEAGTDFGLLMVSGTGLSDWSSDTY